MILSGTDASPVASYSYVGAVLVARPSSAKSKFVLRPWADRLTYDFTANTKHVAASSWGESLSAGYQYAGGPNYLTLFAGVDNRSTQMIPDVGLRNEGTQVSPRFELDATHDLNPDVQFNAIASLVTGTRDYWSRAQVLFGRSVAFGPEYSAQGNTNYREQRTGLAIARVPLGSFSLGIDGGARRLNGVFAGYVALGLSDSLK